MAYKKYKYGVIGPSPADPMSRDLILRFEHQFKPLSETDLSAKRPPIFDQDKLGYCVMFAATSLCLFNDKNDWDGSLTLLSQLFPGILCRQLDGSPLDEDCGTYGRTMMKVLAKYGTCSEALWPYKPEKFAVMPTQECFTDARKRRIYIYQKIMTNFDMRACLTSSWPFLLCIPLFSSFETDEVAETGIVPMPRNGENVVGYHGVYCDGHSDKSGRFNIVNSYGKEWGNEGCFTLPYEYFDRFVLPFGMGDCWVIFK